MVYKKLATIVVVLGLFVTLLAQDAPTTLSDKNRGCYAHKIITFRPAPVHLQLNHQSIEQIVHSMRKNETLTIGTGVNIHHKQYSAQDGVRISKSHSTVFIFSRGFEPRPCAARAALLYEHHCIPTSCPVIGFDYNDSRAHFSFGQDEDIVMLKEIYETVIQQNPSAQIIIVGNCVGAKVALELAAQKPKNLKALVLLTPFISAESIFTQIPRVYIFGLPCATLLQYASRKFTAYNPQRDTLIERLHLIDKHLPIFIGQRMDDAVVPDSEVKLLAKLLQAQGNPIDGLIVYDPTKAHNNLIYNQTIQYRINRFLKQHGFPYNTKALHNGPEQREE